MALTEQFRLLPLSPTALPFAAEIDFAEDSYQPSQLIRPADLFVVRI
jgi:hypothetical protein